MTKESISGKTLLARLATEEERQELADSQIDVILTEPIDFNAYVEVDVLPLPQDMEEGTFYITPDGEASFVAGGRVVTLLPESEIDEKISHLISIQVVEELPETGNEHTLYLVPLEDPEQQDVFDEYIWENGAYEKIGNTRIDLSDYYTKEEVDAIIRENKGQAYTLSESDYNWNSQTKTAVEPFDCIALWLLDSGTYSIPYGITAYTHTTSQSLQPFSNGLIIISSDETNNDRDVVSMISLHYSLTYPQHASGQTFTPYMYSVDKTSGNGQSVVLLNSSSVRNNLTSTGTVVPLAANQGKVLKEMIDETNEKIGQAKVLTTNDYNWNSQSKTHTAPYDSIALWLLPAGYYKVSSQLPTGIAWLNKDTGFTSNDVSYIVNNPDPTDFTTGQSSIIYMINSPDTYYASGYLATTKLGVGASGYSNPVNLKFLQRKDVANDLTTTQQGYVLDARQGKILKEMIDNNVVTRVQTTGQSTTDVMSQKATTDMVYGPYGQGIRIGANPEWDDSMGSIFIGKDAFGSDNYGEIAIGNFSNASGYDGSVALGYRTINYYGGAAVGSFSQGEGEGGLEDFGTISVGSKQSSTFTDEFGNSRTIPAFTRRVVNVKDPEDDQDAATKGYVDGLVGDIETALNVINNGEN